MTHFFGRFVDLRFSILVKLILSFLGIQEFIEKICSIKKIKTTDRVWTFEETSESDGKVEENIKA